MSSLKEVVLGMVARKELGAAQAMALVESLRNAKPGVSAPADASRKPIAIVGMSGRFPGARNVAEFWSNLAAGRCAITEVPASRWDAARYYDPDPLAPGKTCCKWGGFLSGVDEFDAAFFNISPKEAQLMDPQQRLFLEECWRALEDAGYSRQALDGLGCGVFVGAGAGDYIHRLAAEGIAADGYTFMGNANSIMAARISYQLNLKGPSLAVDTACSSALTAIHLAAESLASGASVMALAGGICILETPNFFLAGSKAGMLSRTGQCRAFDRGADGLVPGEAIGVVALKTLERAQADGDRIYGVIEASAINQDGRTNGITAPSAPSQTALETAAYRRAGISAAAIGYVEAHGTGTRLGDPIEIEALTAAFREHTPRTGFCAIGSAKTNVGHTMSAAGVVGLIKVLLSLQHRQLPPSLNFDRENEAIDFRRTPFFVPTTLQPWGAPEAGPRRAALSSFGFSGTNVHLVIAEAPDVRPVAAPPARRLFVLSARSPEALERRRADLAQWLEAHADAPLDAVAYTLLEGRTQFEHRAAFVAGDAGGLLRQLRGGAAESPAADLLAEAAQAYLRGEAVAWEKLHERPYPKRMSLPMYPFEPQSYQLGESSKARRFQGLHPLLDEETPAGFAATFDRDLPFLRDHVVAGKHILPGACMLEMALEAAGRRNGGTGTLRMENAVFHAPLVVEDEPQRVTLHLEEHVFRLTGGGENVVCTGRMAAREAESAPQLDLDDLRRRCGTEIDMGAVTGAFRAAGVACGPFASGLTRLWLGNGEAFGELRLPPGEIRSLGYYNLHPTLVDGAFQAAMALVSLRDPSPPRSVLVPAGVGAVTCDGPPFDRGYAFVQRRGEPDRYCFDIVLLNDEARVVARLGDFQARELHARPKKNAADEQPVSFYRPVWESVAAPAALPEGTDNGRATLIVRFPQDGGLGDALAGRLEDRAVLQVVLDESSASAGPGIFRVDCRQQAEVDRLMASLKPLRETYFIAASAAGGDPLSLLRVLKSLSKAEGTIGLKVVTAGAHAVLPGETPEPPQAQFAAIAQTFSREQPAFAVSVVDLGPEVSRPAFDWQSANGARWVEWLLAECGERPGVVLGYRAERRYTRVLELGPLAASSRAPRLRHGGVYAIMGGAGGLGWVFARHLAARYGARVLLVGRGELPASGRRRLEEMRALGGEAVYARADATDPESLRQALDLAREKWGPLNGAIHAAMVLRDVRIEAMSEEAFGAVLAPKVQGSVTLAELLRGEPLDFLAFFSSANSFFGNAGQANYAAASAFQDAFALSLGKQCGWPVKVINWGFWGEVGAVASPLHRRNAARHGVGSIGAAEGVEAFERVLQSEYAQVMPMKISMESMARLEVPARDPFGAIAGAFDAVERHGRELFLRYLQGRGVFLQPGERHTRDGLFAALEIAPRYARLWGALVDMLVRHGLATQDDGGLYTAELVTQPAELPDARPATRPAWAEPFFKLLDACVGRYDEVLRGKVPATSVLFPGGSMALVAPLYGNNAIVDHYNRLVADAVYACLWGGQSWPQPPFRRPEPAESRLRAELPAPQGTLRVLEVGAGTGGTSAGVLEVLRERPGAVEFHYTDLSPAFVQQAKARLAGTYPFARFGLLNIEREPGSQGFAAGSFDIVVASNVLHATTRIADTLRHVRSLLRPGGTLIVNEATRLRDFTTLTFGLTDGWWLAADPECRIAHSPLLAEDGWRQALGAAGFHPVTACGNEAPGSAQTVFVAGAAAREEAVSAAPREAAPPEALLAAITARVLNLSVPDVDVNRRFAEYGIDSIVGAELVARFSQTLGVTLRATILFDYPSVRQLAAYLAADSETAPAVQRIAPENRTATGRIDELFAPRPAVVRPASPTAIAIVGMSGRFPGAGDVETFWENLRDGKCSIRDVPPDRWDVHEYYDPVPGTPGKSPCKWGGFLDDIDRFDPMFFRMSGAEAEFTDPQQRLFVQEAWKALEDAGYSDRWLDQRKCGVFVGAGAGDYVHNMAARGLAPEPYAFLGNGASILASRISYLLNLRGPAVALDTACSSALMAVHLACQSLRSGDCDLALAGGVFLSTTSAFHYLTGRLGMLSPAGQCRAFDDGADGFVPGEAVGAIVLRPLEAALRDGDRIDAVILASGANQDGHTNGITAPSSVSQAELESEVYRKAAIGAQTITLVEAHGTGTPLGDPLELEGLRQAFRRHTAKTGFCALGSVKTNIGHAGPAAGIASMVKVLLALRHGQIPPSLGFERPNRLIDFDASPFFVNRELRAWTRPADAPRRAAISSFGLSGTNVHLVLEEAPARSRQPERPAPRLLPLSARTPEALQARVAALEEWLSRNGSSHTLTDIAYTLSAGRSHFECRTAIIARDPAAAALKLRDGAPAGGSLTGPEALVAAAQGYLAGEEMDWSALFAGDSPRRISLPTYPFARERYWLPDSPQAARPAEQAVHYFRREWRACALPRLESAPQRIVLVGGRGEAAEELRRLLPGSEVLWIAEGVEQAIAALRAGAAASYGVVLAEPALDDCVAAASALVREFPSEPVRVVVCHPAAGGIHERLIESAAAFARPLAVLRGGISWSAVETAAMADAAAELAIPAALAHPQVRYAGGRREEKHSAPVDLTGGSAPPIRRGGVYWITGGGGALGRKIARYLVQNYGAQVVLTSRNPGASEAGVQSIGADVADLAQMQAAADRIRGSLGQIHGVIHAAGKIDAALLDQKPLAAVHAVFSPKISGSLALDRVTSGDRLDFFALFSSLSALAGDFGQCDYAVANRFLETFAEWRNGQVRRGERHGHTVAVHWPLWAEGGMHFPSDAESRYLDLAGMQALETAAGCQALEVCLASGLDAVAVAAGDPARILRLLGESGTATARRGDAPIAAVITTIRETTAAVVKLNPDRLSTESCFADFGLDSVNMKTLADALSRDYGLPLSPTMFFQHRTIAAFSKHLCQEYPEAMAARHGELVPAASAAAAPEAPAANPIREPARRDGAIAIIGAAGRFPQSHDLEEFWEHLQRGDDLITEIPPERWDWKAWHASSDRDYDKSVSHWGGFMPDLDKFDAAFFGISPREAAYMDPQHRVFLETVWTAVEDAGYRASSLAGRNVGVFAGCQFNEYMGLIGDAGPARAQAALGNTHTMLANRVSFWFDFHGPSEAIDTACSSSLVAVRRAVESLRNGDCELAVAGGVSAILSPETLVLSTQLGMLSPDGRCKTFDKSANGYVKGEGVGAILLKPLDRALADGDHIHAVIRGAAENHGGRANFLTAPNPAAQAQLLVDAYTRAGVDVRSVGYIETHGTGTELGDPIEVDALIRAFAQLGDGSPAAPYCGIGSVKSNIGHLEPAAGIAGLLKVVLAMRHARLPRTLHVREVNPYLKLAGSPFYLATEPCDWEGAPLRAGVSSFGFGGSNAHVVLEQAPAQARLQEEETAAPRIVPVSAKTAEALRASVERLCAYLRSRSVCWPDLVFTLQTGRDSMPERLAVEAANADDLLAKLERWLADPSTAAVHRGSSLKTDEPLALFDTRAELDEFVRREIAAGKWSKLARLWSRGVDIAWSLLPRHGARRISLPTYPFARTRHWFDRTVAAAPAPAAAAPAPSAQPSGEAAASIKSVLLTLLADSLYLEPSQIDENASFTDLGLDSILAVELAKNLKDRFQVDLRATRLYDYSTVAGLAAYLSTMISTESAPLPPPFEPAPAAPEIRSSHPRVRAVVAAVLAVAESDLDDSLDLLDLGLDTVAAQDLSVRIQQEFDVSIAGPRLLSFASLKALSHAIFAAGCPEPSPAAAPKGSSQRSAHEDIAVVGMSGRFPGARNLDEFWANLAAGVDSVTDVPADRWPIENFFDPTPGVPGKTYCRRGGFLRDIDQFDPLFFRISPQEAEWMDPQQRIFLEESWLALEDAGYPDTRLSALRCAIYAGVSQGDYFQRVDPATAAAAQFSLGNVNSILAARLAYFLNLKGPAVAVDTACSSSLVALHLACQALRSGDCELAIAGGVSVMTTPHMYQLGSQGRMLSADGRCKTFDAAADGFVPGEGAGAVVLKPLSAALRDGDRIHAVIRGSGINQDGKTNGITAPSAQSQKELELAVYERFQLDPSTFSYVEAHGTGTKLGDPIEMDALTEAFARYTSRRGFCAVGSVKTNIGHALPASGMAGLLKTVLAMKHGRIPASLHCARENEHIDFAAGPFYVCREPQAWPAAPGNPRRAAVSSFGFSGTNAHVVIEEAPQPPPRARPDTVKPRAFCLSAKTPEALRRAAANLEAWLIADGGASPLDDLSYTLNVRRGAFGQRAAWVASSRDELLAGLRRFLETGGADDRFMSSASAGLPHPVASAAQSWVRGESVDWSALCASPEVRPLSLPGYPFVRRRCWAAPPEAAPPAAPEAAPRVRIRQLADTDELLRDHLVQGKTVLPAVAYLEMARSAAEGAELRHIVWKSPFQVNGAPRQLTVQLQPADGHARFVFTSGGVTHAEGEAHAVDPAPPVEDAEWDTLVAACPAEFRADEIYAAFAGMGISYGPSFRCLEWIRVGERDAVGKIVPRASSADYAIHPGVLDAALQTLIGFAIALRKPAETMLPFALDRFRVYGAVEGICYAHASIATGQARMDVRIVNSSGKLLAALEGFAARPLKTAAAESAESAELMEFRPVWGPAAAPPTPAEYGEAVVFHGPEDFGLVASLARVHAGAAVLSASPRSEVDFERALAGVARLSRVYFLGLSARALPDPDEIDRFQEAGVLALFRLAKALARLENSATGPQLVVVTNNVHRVLEEDRIFPQAASLGGFARAFAAEYPRIPVSIVDLDAHDLNGGQEAMARALATETADPQCGDIAWRRGRRFTRNLEPVEAPLPGSEQPILRDGLRDRGVYVILGGMGGLGLTFARYLAAAQHARLVLVGRSPLTGERQRNLRDLEALGGEAIYRAADVTDAEQMARVRAEVLSKWGAVHGVIHSAFLLRDRSLVRMDEARFREAFDPKANGTAVALWTFREDPLDWFALFSSAISFTGGQGQSNYAAGSALQDALGLYWNAAGKWPVRVLNWGFWGETGAVASDAYRASAAARGVASIGEREGIAAFTRSLSESLPQRVVLKLARGSAPAPAPVKPAAASSSMVKLVRSVVSEALKISPGDLEDDQPFELYGVDSLVSIDIVGALEVHMGKLPETLLFEHNTIAKLAAFLSQSRPQAPAGRSTAAIFPIRETGSNQKSFWVHSVVGEMNWAVRLAHHLGPEWPLFGFQAASAQSAREPFASLEEMAAAYCADLRAVQPRGPYILGGFSFGGSVAFEMARQLEQSGETVSWLVLLDAYAPGSQALGSLMRLAWDGFLPRLIANLLIRQWGGTALLTTDSLPKNDPEAQIRMAARQVLSACNTPQTEEEIAAVMANSIRLATRHAELQEAYQPQPCHAIQRAVLFRNRHGFVGRDSDLALPTVAVDDTAPDHGWTRWLPAPPLIHKVDADHFSLGLEPAIGIVGRRLAELFRGGPQPSPGHRNGAERMRVFDVVKGHVMRILPDVPPAAVTPEVRLKDLGANSLDRIEVATCAMEELDVDLPRTRLAGVDNLQSLVEVLLAGLSKGGNGS